MFLNSVDTCKDKNPMIQNSSSPFDLPFRRFNTDASRSHYGSQGTTEEEGALLFSLFI
jgi:hypothetical protein